jgi:protein-L-isoaspartate(D-aspartate) O-methyltransferase
MDAEQLRHKRLQMVESQLAARDIDDERVLEAMRQVPRHEFVPPELQALAYEDRPLAIGYEQTISQPYVIALMLQLLHLSGHETVLEIGTGSGYQTALLSRLAAYVYSVERHDRLALMAADRLFQLGYTQLDIHVGDGSQGLADMAPFDAIIVSAAAPSIPGPLKAQMQVLNGRLVLPVGHREQQGLQLVRRDLDQWQTEDIIPVRFVPLIGLYGFAS